MEKQLNSESIEPAVESDFSKLVEESKANIQGAEMVPPKAGRGRKKLPRDANGKIIRDGSGRVVPGTAASPSVAQAGVSIPGTPPPDISKFLIQPIKSISKIPADRLGVKELAFDDSEAGASAQALSDLYAVFAPAGQMNPKTAAICNCGLVFGTILFTKYQIYLAHKPSPTPDAPLVEDLPQGQTFPSVPAESVFRRQ